MLRVPWRRPRERARWLPIPYFLLNLRTSTRGLERRMLRATVLSRRKTAQSGRFLAIFGNDNSSLTQETDQSIADTTCSDKKLKSKSRKSAQQRQNEVRGAPGAMEAAHGRLGNACLLLSRATGALEAACAEYEAAQQTVKRWCVILTRMLLFQSLLFNLRGRS